MRLDVSTRSSSLATRMALGFMAERLGDRAGFVGGDVTLADCQLAMLAVVGGFLAVAPPDSLMAHRARLFARPALAETLRAEGFAT